MWLEATRVSTAPGSTVSRITGSPVMTAASERVVGMPSANMASLTMYSRSTGPERGAAVAAAGERGGARALELDVAADAVRVDDLAEQDRPAVAELGHEIPELVAGIGHGDGVGARGNRLSGQDFGALRGLQQVRIEPELDRQRPVQLDQPGRGHGGRRDAGKEAVRQRRIRVLEGEMDCHGLKIGLERLMAKARAQIGQKWALRAQNSPFPWLPPPASSGKPCRNFGPAWISRPIRPLRHHFGTTMHRYRSHTCGALRESNIGETIRLSGWVHRVRDHGGVLFIDLRDHYGLTQCVVDPDSPAFSQAEKLRSEFVVKMDGKVRRRPAEQEHRQ